MAIIQNSKGINRLSEQNVNDLYKVNPTADPDIGKLYNAGVFDKEPTISDISSGFQAPTFQQDISPEMFNYDLTPRQERDIRRGVLSQFQGEIDASRNAYADLLAQVKQQSAGRLGEDTARQASRGLLGSDFGAAQTEGVRQQNITEEQKVLAARASALAGIQSEAARLAQSEIQNRRASKQQGSQAYIEYLASAPERKAQRLETLANALINQNIDPSSLGAKELDKIAKNAGLTSADIINSYLGKKQEAEQAEAERQAQLAKDMSFNLSEGQARYQYNPETGQTELVAERAKTYAPKSSISGGSNGGSLYANDLDAVIGSTISIIPSKFGQEQFQNQLSRARNDSDKINLVASQVLKNQPAEIKRDFVNQANAISNIDRAIAEIDKGVSTGFLENAAQYTFNVFGKDFDPKLSKINANITAAIQPYRSSITGAAWGDQEDAEYAALFGSTKYSPTELRSRLVNLKEILKTKSADGLNSYVNPLGYYDNQFQTGSLAPTQETFVGDDGVEYYIVD